MYPTGCRPLLIFKAIIPTIKLFYCTFLLIVTEIYFSNLSIISNLNVICIIVSILIKFKDNVTCVQGINIDTCFRISCLVSQKCLINTFNIRKIQSCKHISHSCIMCAINIPLYPLFVGNNFLYIINSLVVKTSSGGSYLFLVHI